MSVLVEQGIDIRPVITHRFAAADYEEALATVREGQCGKVIMNWEA
jgi:threonine 3-dehydrogenase